MKMRKYKGLYFKGRFKDVISAPDNKDIPRHKNSGKIINGSLIMHNGIKVTPRGYYGDFSKILELNKGVHEPKEEKVFARVLHYIQDGGTILELGAYWSFYSMWFNKEIKNAKCYMIEPNKENLLVGKKNFELNNIKGDFTLGKIGFNHIKLDDFVKSKDINKVDILHADIQGSEFEMLLGAKKLINEGRIKYFFISTHSQELHCKCLDFLKHHGYIIIASADFDKQTYSYDGLIVARLAKINGCEKVDISLADWNNWNIINNLYELSAKLKQKSKTYRRFISFIKTGKFG